VATSLGFTTMSLYRYVTSKDDLLLLMQDSVLPEAMPPEPVGNDWRAELREWVLFSLAVFRAHPWFSDIPISGIPLTPGNLRVVDAGLRCLRSTPLTDHEKMATMLLAAGYAKSVGAIERDIARALETGSDPAAVAGHRYDAVLGELVTEERFPYLRPVLLSGAYTDSDMEYDDVAYGLERLLDGIARFVDERPTDAGIDASEYAAGRQQAEIYSRDSKVKELAKRRHEAEVLVRDLAKQEREAVQKAHEAAEKLAAKRR
jgi:AcrR family transcriptional regulator